MKQLLLPLAKHIFRALPLNDRQRLQLVSLVFDLTGERFKFLPSYQLYLRNRKWLKAPVPKDLAASRAALLAKHFSAEQGKAMVMISHTLGGGTGQHVDDISARLEGEGWRVFYLERHNQDHLRLVTPQFARGEPLFFRWPEDIPALIKIFRQLGVAHLHLHHTVDLPSDFLPHFYEIATQLGVAYDYTVHDYFSICPRFTLFDEAVRGYCGEPQDVRKCSACVKHHGSAIGKDVDVGAWREMHSAMLATARKVFVPDSDVGNRLKRYFPAVNFLTMPHPEVKTVTSLAAARLPGQPLKVVTIGGIAPHKGSKVLFDCAQDALQRNLPLEFHLVGYSDIDHKLKGLKNVTVSGHFKLAELPQKLEIGQYHLAFLPAVWPETYNYVLSECWRHGFYTVGLDIGAIASRLKAAPKLGMVFPLEWYFQPQKINDALLELKIPGLDPADVVAALTDYPSFTKDYYALPQPVAH